MSNIALDRPAVTDTNEAQGNVQKQGKSFIFSLFNRHNYV